MFRAGHRGVSVEQIDLPVAEADRDGHFIHIPPERWSEAESKARARGWAIHTHGDVKVTIVESDERSPPGSEVIPFAR